MQLDIQLAFEECSNTLATIAQFARTSTIKETKDDILDEIRREPQDERVRYVDGKWRDSVTMESINKEGVTLKSIDNEWVEIQGHLDSKTTDTDVTTVTRLDNYGESTCRCRKCGKEVHEWEGYAEQHKLTVTAAAVRHWYKNGVMPDKQTTNKPSGRKERHSYSGPDITQAANSGATLEYKTTEISDGSTRTRWWLEWDVWRPACQVCKELALARICKLSKRKKRED